MNSSDNAAAGAAAVGAMAFVFLIYAVIIALVIAVHWKIASKAGYPGWYALGLLVPCVNLVLIVLFAFTEWPIERELRELRGMSPQPGNYPRYPQSPTP
jgi:hypothetical protein